MLLYARLAPSKIPKRRSRAGCASCKEKKKKCDEERPCARCSERGLDCTYEPVKPRQRRKQVPTAPGRNADRAPRPCFSVRVPSEGSLYSDDDNEEKGTSWEHEFSPVGFSLDDLSDLAISPPLEPAFDATALANPLSADPLVVAHAPPYYFDFLPEVSEDEPPDESVQRDHRYSPGRTILSSPTGAYVGDMAMVTSRPVNSPLMNFFPPAFSEFSDRANRRALVNHFCSVLSHLIVFREESGNPFQQLVLPLTQKSSAVLNAIYALTSAHLEYGGVEHEEKSIYFHSKAIQSLAALIQRGGKESRNEILATIMLLVYYEVLVQSGQSNIVDGHLKGALTVMSANSEQLDTTGIFLERAFRFYDVIVALSNGTGPLSAAPAAGCLMPFPPLGATAASPLSNVDTLLGLAHTLWPIIHRLSNLLSLKRELAVAVQNKAISSKIAVLRTEFESTAEAIESALSEWQPSLPPGPLREELRMEISACVSGVVDIEARTDATLPSTASAAGAIAEHGRIRSTLHNALAYRHSAFVYLYRTIHGHPRSHALVQKHTHLSLVHCAATVSHAGPMGALLWPLFVAACEAMDKADRGLAGRAFEAVKARQGMMNIERAWEIVKEVWKRADLTERREHEKSVSVEMTGTDGGVQVDAQVFLEESHSFPRSCYQNDRSVDLWRRVKEEMGVNIVFG